MRSALVTGACGLLGQHLVKRLQSGYRVFTVDIAPNIFEDYNNVTFIQQDLTESSALRNILFEKYVDIVYNCAAYNDVDGCEDNRDKAYELNIGLVENLVNSGCERVIHFSTDYVFNGENGPYEEDDETDPIGYYGKTKLIAEQAILKSEKKHLVIRTNVLFGNGIKVRPNFITWLIDNLQRGDELKIVIDQYNNPIHADNLAEASIEAEESGFTGILHLAGDSYLSRYEIACKTANHFSFNEKLIFPAKTSELGQAAKRPLKGGLKIDKAKRLLKSRLLKFERALELL
jgi:dTDP-4-dehydrorhamnose reductase